MRALFSHINYFHIVYLYYLQYFIDKSIDGFLIAFVSMYSVKLIDYSFTFKQSLEKGNLWRIQM